MEILNHYKKKSALHAPGISAPLRETYLFSLTNCV
jgi:hypothetical protein